MTWFAFALIAPMLWGLSNLIDVDLERRQVRDPLAITLIAGLTSTIPLIVIAASGQFVWVGWLTALLAIARGIIGLLVYVPYLRALDYASPATVVLMWNVAPVFVVVMAWATLGERLAPLDYLAMVFLIVGSVFIAYRPGAGTRSWNRACSLVLLASIMSAIEVTLEKAVFDRVSFAAGFWWISASTFGTAIGVLIVHPRSRRIFLDALRRRTPLLVGNELLDLAAVTARARATSMGSVSLVNAIGGLQPLAIVFFTAVGSALHIRGVRMPRRAELFRIAIATACAVVGLSLIRSIE